MREYDPFDFASLTFIVRPVLLAGALAWAAFLAWRRRDGGTPRHSCFRYFGEDNLNVWITFPPFVWLPAVMVLAAVAGHLLIFRALGLGPHDGLVSQQV